MESKTALPPRAVILVREHRSRQLPAPRVDVDAATHARSGRVAELLRQRRAELVDVRRLLATEAARGIQRNDVDVRVFDRVAPEQPSQLARGGGVVVLACGDGSLRRRGWGRVAATPQPRLDIPWGRRQGRDADSSRRRVAATPRPRRG